METNRKRDACSIVAHEFRNSRVLDGTREKATVLNRDLLINHEVRSRDWRSDLWRLGT